MLKHEQAGLAVELAAGLAPRLERVDTRQSHHRAVERVIGAMRGRLEDSFSLEDMAGVAIMSRFHFNRTFRRVTGVPPCQFLSAVRLETAKRLLLTTRLSITDVCFEVGYNSLGTFIRRFRELVGLSPGRLRSAARATQGWRPFPGAASNRPAGTLITGRVTTTEPVRGPIFVGLFATPMPQGRPVACAVLAEAGPYHIPLKAEGEFHLFAAAHAWSRDPRSYLMCESALRGGGQALSIAGGRVSGPTGLCLRAAAPTDPPILMAFPFVRPREARGTAGGRAANAANTGRLTCPASTASTRS